MTKISIIIPSYNKEKYIKRTLDSVFSQSFSNFELIIIDCSTDKSPEIIKEYSDRRLKYIRCEKNSAAKSRNLGVSYAKSDLIAFLDADDEWTETHLEQLYHLYTGFPDAGLYSTPYVKIRHNGSPMVMVFAGIPKPPWEGYIPRYFWSCSKGDVPVNSSSCAIRKEIFREMGGFREGLIYGEDQDLWGRIALQYPIAFTWGGIAIYHTEAEGRICQLSHFLSDDPFSFSVDRILKSSNTDIELKKDLERYIRRKKISITVSNLFCGHNKATDLSAREPQNPHGTVCIMIFSMILSKFAQIIIYLYNSRLNDLYRKIICTINGWYIPQFKN